MNLIVAFLVLLLSLAGEVAAQSAGATANAGASAQAGNSSAMNVGAGNVQSLAIQGGEAPKLLPQPPVASVSVPQVFQFLPNQAGMPVELTGAALDNAYLMACKPRGGRKSSGTRFGQGVKTKFVFTAHQNLVLGDGARPEVEVDLSGSATIRCLGKLTIAVTPEAVKEGYPIDLTALTEDAMNSVADILKGVEGEVVILSHLGFWGGGLGLAGQGTGSTAGLGLNVGAFLGIGGSSTSGVNFPMSRGGMMFIVGIRAADDDPRGVKIALQPTRPDQQQPVGSNGKKLQGTQ